MKSAALSLYFALLVRVVVGQSSTPSSSAAPSLVETGSGSTVATHVVTVGKVGNALRGSVTVRAKKRLMWSSIAGVEPISTGFVDC